LSGTTLFYTGGNVGIGTASPVSKLDVNGTLNATSLCIAGDCKTAWSQVGGSGATGWAVSGINVYNDTTNVKVGIGTASPSNKLSIYGTSGHLLNLSNDTTSMGFYIGGLSGGVGGASLGTITNHGLSLFTNNTDKVTILANGNVGIGTTSPGEKLDVQGNTGIGLQYSGSSASGNIKLTYKSGSNPSCGKFTLARKWTQKTCSACSSCQTSAGWLSSDAPVCGYYMNFDAMCPCCADGAYCTADTWTEAICFD
jgi:hypothetical protein